MTTQIGSVKIDTRVLDKITAEMRPKASATVQKYGWAIANTAATKHPWKLRTGALTGSILSESRMEGDMTFIIQDGVEYGVFLELGTSKMPAYPFMLPAVEVWRQKFLDAFGGLFK